MLVLVRVRFLSIIYQYARSILVFRNFFIMDMFVLHIGLFLALPEYLIGQDQIFTGLSPLLFDLGLVYIGYLF